ncbi:hypothetical protein TNCV_636121 [Trichonephila clavipes]|nr:hypothetical protein TNCV_636121 [Trichonephila clavipes]
MVLKANDRRTSCPCHDEFRGPRSDYVRQVALATTTTTKPDGHGYELVSSVRALVPQKFSVEEELMHIKHVEVKSPHVGVMWKFGKGVICSGIVLVT